MTSFRKLSFVAALASIVAVPAALAAVGGGGATLPARAYQGTNATADATGPRFSVPAAGSLFAEGAPGVTQSYCQTGSGAGRSVLINSNNNTNDTRDCPAKFTDSFVNGTNGFNSPRNDADFAGSDAPATATEFSTYVSNLGKVHTQMVQFPSIVGNVAVIFHNSRIVDGTAVYLTEAELCNIWSGRITNWSQLVDRKGRPYKNKAITLVYRGDSSGTSFGFSNHLNWVCQDASLDEDLADAAAPLPFAVTDNFSVNSTFASAFPSSTGIPRGALSASGNPGVISQVQATDGAIGYAEAANLLATSSSSPDVHETLIAALDTNELDPTTPNTGRDFKKYIDPVRNGRYFTLPASYVDKDGGTYNSVYTDRALQANDANKGRPVGLGTALDATQAPVADCVFLVQPGAYATSQYRTAGDPTTGYASYPIGVVTYLLSNFSGNGAATKDLRAVLSSPYLPGKSQANVTSIGAMTGYSYLTGVAATPLHGTGTIGLSRATVSACVNR